MAAPATAAASVALGTAPAGPAIMEPLQASSFVQATKEDRKMYITNFPYGINAATVFSLCLAFNL